MTVREQSAMPTATTPVAVADARAAFSEAADGNMSTSVGTPDPGARGRLAATVDVADDALVFMRQVHGRGVHVVTRAARGRGPGEHADGVAAVDALVTFDEGVAPAVLVADCVPVLLVDPGRAVAAVHAGRGGVASGIVDATLDVVAPPDPSAVTALIGPAIGGCCYEVEPELADAVAAHVPRARATTTWGTAALDLPAGVVAQLESRGVRRVTRVGGCTRCSGERWFSHRRAPGAGRQAGVIVRGAAGGAGPQAGTSA